VAAHAEVVGTDERFGGDGHDEGDGREDGTGDGIHGSS